jgi:YegS/Rv2252/BmrU family lipid kinase
MVEKKNRRIYFIVNPKSGLKIRGRRIRLEIEKIARDRDEKIEIVETHYRGEGSEWAKKAIRDGFDVIIAVGGDGTINDVASALIGKDVSFGIIPAGSGNGFARNFGFPLEPAEALDLIFRSVNTKYIDVGKVQNHYFFNVFGIGFDAAIAREFEKMGIRGPVPYFWAGIKSYFRYTPPQLQVKMEDEKFEYHPFLLSFANGKQFGNGAIIAPDARESDGKLDMVYIPRLNMFKLIANISRLFNGSIHELEEVRIEKIEKVSIFSEQPIEGHVDGEPVQLSNLISVEVIPNGLKIISD